MRSINRIIVTTQREAGQMKKAITLAVTLCIVLSLFTVHAFAAEPTSTDAAPPEPTPVETEAPASEPNPDELYPVEVIQDVEKQEIRKIYELSPETDPSLIPRDDFEQGGYAYAMTDILREVVIGEEFKAVTMTETAESKKNDMDTILALLPQYKEVEDEDGFTGSLLLNTATIKAEVAGYGSGNSEYSVTRSYPNLSDADTQYLPKTIDDGGRTLNLTDVQWQEDNTMNVDDYEIPDRYSAVATYTGTKSYSYVTGYTVTADYSGEVARKGVTAIRYTVIFTGMLIPVPTTEPTPSPTPEPIQEETESEAADLSWLPYALSAAALLCGGGALFIGLRNRKDKKRDEENNQYNYLDAPYYDEPDGDAPGDGDRDGEGR
jgi:hypothetical protein